MALFDNDKEIIGTTLNGIKVSDVSELKDLIAEREIHIVIIAVPALEAQNIIDVLVESEVRGVWNFSPIKLRMPAPKYIVNADLSVGLTSLSYYLSKDAANVSIK